MKQIRLAIIGCGGFVRSHVRAILDHVPEFKIVALCDLKRAYLEKWRRTNLPRRRPALYTDHKKLLAREKPEAVIVSTPHTLHFRHCYDALDCGAHVMVEKPMVTNSGHARRLVAKAEKADRALQIAIQGTHTDTFAYARSLISDGTLGDLQLITGVMAQGWMALTKGKWRQEPRLSGGGQLYDSTSHVLSAMMFLVDSPVREVFCWTDYKGTNVDINAVGCIKFDNGCMGTVTSGGNSPSFTSDITLQAANAVLKIRAHGGNFRVSSSHWDKPITGVPRGWKLPTVTPARNFADVILGKAEPRCAARLGVLLADLMDGLYASASAGRPVKLPGKLAKK